MKKEEKKASGTRKLVKCLVCGEIFDSSLDTCPVCGVGRDKFVEVEVEETAFRNDTQNTYVILGNGCAGVSAAQAIRERDKTGQDGPHPAHLQRRPGLPAPHADKSYALRPHRRPDGPAPRRVV